MPDTSPTAADAALIMQLSTDYWRSQAFLTANRIGLFAQLANGDGSAAETAVALGLAERPLQLLMNACVALGLLEQAAGRYRNSPTSARFLVPGAPAYMGEAVRYSDDLYTTWGRLEQTLAGGKVVGATTDYLGADAERTRHFVYGMHNRALGMGQALVQMLDLSGRRRMLDIGGGPGTYAALFTQRFPGLRAIVLDLPPVVALARDIVAGMNAADAVEFLPGDYHASVFPGGNDVVLISGVLHRESPATCQELVRRAADSLDPGGLLIVSDVFTDAGGDAPAFATLFGLNMLLTADDGGVHSVEDLAEWMRAAGLVAGAARSFPPPMPHRFISGQRP